MRMLVVQVEGIDILEGLKDMPFPFTENLVSQNLTTP
jgi:hypothetical protein